MALLKETHFGTLLPQDINKKEESIQNKNTITNENKSERIFKDYLTSLGLENMDFYTFTEEELDHYLRSFWFNIRTQKGEHYTSSLLEIICYGLNRALKRYGHNFDSTKRESIYFTRSITAHENA